MTPWTAARQTSLSFTISWSLLKFMSIESMMPSKHLKLCCPLFQPFATKTRAQFATSAWPWSSIVFFFFYIKEPLFVYLFLAGSWFSCMGILAVSRGYSLAAARGLLVVASLVSERRLLVPGLSSCGTPLSCSETCGIFPDQRSNPCPLHW